jgi:hypothetical protein
MDMPKKLLELMQKISEATSRRSECHLEIQFLDSILEKLQDEYMQEVRGAGVLGVLGLNDAEKAMARGGNRISAIKAVRERSESPGVPGLGLLEAKNMVDDYLESVGIRPAVPAWRREDRDEQEG